MSTCKLGATKLALAVCVVVMGCKQKAEPPATGSGSSGSATGSATAGSGSAACLITVAVNLGSITYEGGGIAGNVDRKPGEQPNLAVLKPFGGKCSVFLTADPALSYKDVFAVIDALAKDGLYNVALGKPGDKPEAPPITHAGTPLPDLGSAVLSDALTLSVTKTQITLRHQDLGKPDDATLESRLATALPANPADPTLILAADDAVPAATIHRIITVAKTQGYTNVLFAGVPK